MKSTFRILFYLKKNEPKKDGTVTIMARITVDGETKQFSTKKTILPEDWDIKSGRAVNKSGKSTSAKISKLNKELDDLRGQISIQYTKQLNNNGYVEPEKLRNKVLGIEEKQHSLLTYFTEHNLQYKDKVGTTATQKTYSRYELTKQRLIDFMKVKYRVSDILIREINAVFIENFYLYLRNEHGINNNTAMKFVQRFHSILIYAKNSGLNFIDPFGSFKFSFDKVAHPRKQAHHVFCLWLPLSVPALSVQGQCLHCIWAGETDRAYARLYPHEKPNVMTGIHPYIFLPMHGILLNPAPLVPKRSKALCCAILLLHIPVSFVYFNFLINNYFPLCAIFAILTVFSSFQR